MISTDAELSVLPLGWLAVMMTSASSATYFSKCHSLRSKPRLTSSRKDLNQDIYLSDTKAEVKYIQKRDDFNKGGRTSLHHNRKIWQVREAKCAPRRMN